MAKPVILTGLRANNDLHIGNYFGGMLPLITMATTRSAEFDINMFIPDLHSFTTPIDHSKLHDQILGNARLYAAAGLPLDNDAIHLYRQSYVPAHSEMTWILDCFTGMGEMSRMTQFKDKAGTLLSRGESVDPPVSEVDGELVFDQAKAVQHDNARQDRISVGLFNYPVLMAADILLYNAKYIPVGDDQTQHLEFARDIAERMNKKFSQELFAVPEPVAKQHEFFGKDAGLRIKDLANPSKKMSKSDETGKGVIFLGDAPEIAHRKVMSATTDSLASVNYDKATQPGIANLIDILALLRGAAPLEVAAEFKGMTRYGDFKKIVADEVAAFLADFQARLASVDAAAIQAKLKSSEHAMNTIANDTLLRVQKAVGLRK